MQFNSTFKVRFWAKVRKTNGCWLWTAGLSAGRYGSIGYGPRGTGLIKAHRASWVLHFGKIPRGLFVLHRRDTPLCVRPDHLFLGTQAENVADMDAKGRRRSLRGEKHHCAKLTPAKVRAIRRRYIPGRVRQADLAAVYGVSQVLIGLIINRKAWAHV